MEEVTLLCSGRISLLALGGLAAKGVLLAQMRENGSPRGRGWGGQGGCQEGRAHDWTFKRQNCWTW